MWLSLRLHSVHALVEPSWCGTLWNMPVCWLKKWSSMAQEHGLSTQAGPVEGVDSFSHSSPSLIWKTDNDVLSSRPAMQTALQNALQAFATKILHRLNYCGHVSQSLVMSQNWHVNTFGLHSASCHIFIDEPQSVASESSESLLMPYRTTSAIFQTRTSEVKEFWPALCRYGVGSRIKLKFTRAIIDAIHSGELADAEVTSTPIFDLQVNRLPQ